MRKRYNLYRRLNDSKMEKTLLLREGVGECPWGGKLGPTW